MFYNDFIFDYFKKYQQKYQQKNLLPPLNSIFVDFVGIKKPSFLGNEGKITARLPTHRI